MMEYHAWLQVCMGVNAPASSGIMMASRRPRPGAAVRRAPTCARPEVATRAIMADVLGIHVIDAAGGLLAL